MRACPERSRGGAGLWPNWRPLRNFTHGVEPCFGPNGAAGCSHGWSTACRKAGGVCRSGQQTRLFGRTRQGMSGLLTRPTHLRGSGGKKKEGVRDLRLPLRAPTPWLCWFGNLLSRLRLRHACNKPAIVPTLECVLTDSGERWDGCEGREG